MKWYCRANNGYTWETNDAAPENPCPCKYKKCTLNNETAAEVIPTDFVECRRDVQKKGITIHVQNKARAGVKIDSFMNISGKMERMVCAQELLPAGDVMMHLDDASIFVLFAFKAPLYPLTHEMDRGANGFPKKYLITANETMAELHTEAADCTEIFDKTKCDGGSTGRRLLGGGGGGSCTWCTTSDGAHAECFAQDSAKKLDQDWTCDKKD